MDKTLNVPDNYAPSARLHWTNLTLINVYYVGLTSISQTMTPLVIPLLIQQFVGENQQATFYGNLRLWSLMVALIIQALVGTLSDRSTISWGKRKPFILLGSLLVITTILAIGWSASLSGISGYWTLFFLVILLMLAANIAHGAQQGLIPDLVPENQRGVASGFKALFEVPIPLILVAFSIGPLIGRGQYWAALFILIAIIIFVTGLTMFVKESKPFQQTNPIDWQPFTRLLMMTGVFTGLILTLGGGVSLLRNMLPVELSLQPAMLILGAAGLAAMTLAIGLGVLLSVRIGLGAKEASQNPAFGWWVVNRLAFLVASTNIASFAVFFLQGRLGYAQEEAAQPASLLLLIVGVFILVTALPSGWLSDRLGHRRLIAAAGLGASMGVLIIVLATSLTTIYLGAVLIGITTGIFYTSNWALGTELVPKAAAGKYLGISNLAGAGAGAVGAFIGGPVADFFTTHYSQTPGIGYVVLFVIYGCLFLFSVLTLRFLPQK
jgi:MFS family permease